MDDRDNTSTNMAQNILKILDSLLPDNSNRAFYNIFNRKFSFSYWTQTVFDSNSAKFSV